MANRTRDLSTFPFVYLDARYEKLRNNGKVIDVAVLIAIGVNNEGRREVLGVSVDLSEAEVHWRLFLTTLKERGLRGSDLIISDAHEGLAAARRAVFSEVPWQRCQFHFAQNAQHYAPTKGMREEIAEAVRSVFQASSKKEALDNVDDIIRRMEKSVPKFCTWLGENVEECLQIYDMPESFRKKLRTVNPLELTNREIKRRTRVARVFPNTDSLLRLVTAVLVEIHEDWITSKMPYLNMKERAQHARMAA